MPRVVVGDLAEFGAIDEVDRHLAAVLHLLGVCVLLALGSAIERRSSHRLDLGLGEGGHSQRARLCQ